MASVPISKVRPDFQDMYSSLEKKLERKGTWIDILPTAVGTTLLDMFAGSSVSNQFYIDASFREAFLPTAVRDSSIFAGTRMLGVRLARKTPSACTAELTNNSTRTHYVPPYTMFDIAGSPFFTRSQYVIPPRQKISNVNLFQGEVREKTFALDIYENLELREFFLQEPGFVVSENDILVYTTDINTGTTVEWAETDNAIFEHGEEDAVYYVSTPRDGDASLMFGDGTYGRALYDSEVLHVRYVVTEGAGGNENLPGSEVTLLNDRSLSGETLTPIKGGSDEKNSLYYKMFAPKLSRTKRKAISGSEIRAKAVTYPGVADAVILGQRDIAPSDPRWQNMIRICLLPENEDTFGGANPNPKSAAWQQFIDWIQPMLHNAYEIQRWNPEKIYVRPRARIGIRPSADPAEVKQRAIEAILTLFKKRPGLLGRRLSLSDFDVLKKIEGVDYILLDDPEGEIIPDTPTSYVVLDGMPQIDVFYSERTVGIAGI